MISLGWLKGQVRMGRGRRADKLEYLGAGHPDGLLLANDGVKKKNSRGNLAFKPVVKVSPLKMMIDVINSVKFEDLQTAAAYLKQDGFLKLLENDAELKQKFTGPAMKSLQLATSYQCLFLDRKSNDDGIVAYSKRKLSDDFRGFLGENNPWLVQSSKIIKRQAADRIATNNAIFAAAPFSN